MNGRLFSGILIIILSISGICATFVPCVAKAGDTKADSPDAHFAAAIDAIKKNDLDSARQSLLEIDKKYPKQLAVLHNLALIAVKKNQLGPAIAIWRKAQYEYPTDENIDASILWTLKKLPKTELTKDYDIWESIRNNVLHKTSPLFTVILSVLIMVLGGWSLLRWTARRQRALDQETAIPPLPIAGITLTVVFLFLTSIAVCQFIDRVDIRGTVLPQKTEVRSAADSTATVLFEIFEGMEVLVLDSRTVGDTSWRRIHYPGGMSGWVKETDIMTTDDGLERAL